MDEIDALVDWQLSQCPPVEKPGVVVSWRGCANDHAWQTDVEIPAPCPRCGLPAT